MRCLAGTKQAKQRLQRQLFSLSTTTPSSFSPPPSLHSPLPRSSPPRRPPAPISPPAPSARPPAGGLSLIHGLRSAVPAAAAARPSLPTVARCRLVCAVVGGRQDVRPLLLASCSTHVFTGSTSTYTTTATNEASKRPRESSLQKLTLPQSPLPP